MGLFIESRILKDDPFGGFSKALSLVQQDFLEKEILSDFFRAWIIQRGISNGPEVRSEPGAGERFIRRASQRRGR